MPKINKLPPHVADLIAAGEVVERPASAAKELIENAIDAGAKSIIVESKGGGSVFLRITDDGCGMSCEDAQNAFLRHATSKISTAEDLTHIKTLGFRGEALAAISAVSRIDLLTREQGGEFGTSIHAEGGEIMDVTQAGCPLGTTIIVRDLFYNTPARRAFLKKENYEALQINGVVTRAAQSHPKVAFSLLRDGREELRTSGNGELSACLHSIWGRDVAAQLASVKTKHLEGELTGFIARPSVTRGSREMQYFFVNGRPVRSRSMYAGLEEAFRHSIPNGRYPICSLHLTIPEHLYDVNVHPTKLEVKFAQERSIFEIVFAGVRDALSGGGEHKRWTAPAPASAHTAETVAETVSTPAHAPKTETAPMPVSTYVAPKPVAVTLECDDTPEPLVGSYAQTRINTLIVECPPEPVSITITKNEVTEQQEQQILQDVDDFRFIGEVLGGFLVVEKDNELILIDKHAAHERKLFEQLTANGEAPMSQSLIAPVIVTLAPNDCAVIVENEKLLNEAGFDLSSFGGATVAIRAVPAGVEIPDAAAMLSEMAAILRKGKRTPWEVVRESLLEMVACKAAVKVGRGFSEREALEIVRWVMSDRNIWHCPHGRPVAVVLSREDINKQFLR